MPRFAEQSLTVRVILLFLSSSLFLGATDRATAAALPGPIAVSPGSPERRLTVRDGCPTFSWSAIAGAEGFELRVYRVDETAERAALQRRLPSTLSWTPAVEECLSPARYAWIVRAQAASGWTEWSEPRLFDVRIDGRVSPGSPGERNRAGLSAGSVSDSRQPPPDDRTRSQHRPASREPSAITAAVSVPPACSAGEEIFSDVAASHPFCAWIHELYHHGVTSGCGSGPLRFCPDNAVTRGQLAVFLDSVLEQAFQARSPRQLDASDNSHVCAVLASGRVVCWGFNGNDEAPPGPSVDTFQSVATGVGWTCGVRTDGAIACWGSGTPPTPAGTFSSLSAGGNHFCAVRTDGKVMCSGYDGDGAAPPGPSADTYLSVSAGWTHTCGVNNDSKVVCWGADNLGQAPEGPSGDTFQSVSAGDFHTCGVRTNGTLSCWGSTPAPPVGTFRSVAGGAGFTCGVRADAKVVCWGNNTAGQAPPGPSAETFQSVATGSQFSCGIRSNGTVECWGSGFGQGETIPPLGL
jgi:hypothetical protein